MFKSCDEEAPLLMIGTIGCALLAGLALAHSPVFDEKVRLSAGCAVWEFGYMHLNPGNPPLADLVVAAPVCIRATEGEVKELVFGRAMPERLIEFVCTGRLAQIPFHLLGAWLCYRWARELFGYLPGLCVLLLWCLDPLILAHGSLITGDICSASIGLAGMYVFWKWMQRPALSGAILCGIALGFVLLSKFVWIVMPLLWGVLWIVRRLVSPRPQRWPLFGHLTVIALLAVYVVNSGYAFESTFQPWRSFQFRSPWLQQLAVDPQTTSGLLSWFGSIPIPVPRNYIMGIDAVADHLETASYPTYVRGDFHDGNVWWFHAYGLLVKMPLGTCLLLVVALYASLRGDTGELVVGGEGTGAVDSRHRFTDLVLWLPAMTVLVFVSWATQIKLLRYILPMLPFVFIWIGHAFVWAQHGRWWRKAIVYGALVWSLLSSLWVYPHSLSYFNEAAGGPANGHAHLIWASFDWGQDMLFLKDWADQHPEARPLYVSCHGAVAPELVGISSQSAPYDGPQPGWYAVSASMLRGISRPRNPGTIPASSPHVYLESFLELEPTDRVAYSIFIYHLDRQQVNALRAKLGLALIE